jgi:hypothetical protein
MILTAFLLTFLLKLSSEGVSQRFLYVSWLTLACTSSWMLMMSNILIAQLLQWRQWNEFLNYFGRFHFDSGINMSWWKDDGLRLFLCLIWISSCIQYFCSSCMIEWCQPIHEGFVSCQCYAWQMMLGWVFYKLYDVGRTLLNYLKFLNCVCFCLCLSIISWKPVLSGVAPPLWDISRLVSSDRIMYGFPNNTFQWLLMCWSNVLIEKCLWNTRKFHESRLEANEIHELQGSWAWRGFKHDFFQNLNANRCKIWKIFVDLLYRYMPAKLSMHRVFRWIWNLIMLGNRLLVFSVANGHHWDGLSLVDNFIILRLTKFEAARLNWCAWDIVYGYFNIFMVSDSDHKLFWQIMKLHYHTWNARSPCEKVIWYVQLNCTWYIFFSKSVPLICLPCCWDRGSNSLFH